LAAFRVVGGRAHSRPKSSKTLGCKLFATFRDIATFQVVCCESLPCRVVGGRAHSRPKISKTLGCKLLATFQVVRCKSLPCRVVGGRAHSTQTLESSRLQTRWYISNPWLQILSRIDDRWQCCNIAPDECLDYCFESEPNINTGKLLATFRVVGGRYPKSRKLSAANSLPHFKSFAANPCHVESLAAEQIRDPKSRKLQKSRKHNEWLSFWH
jgi:hypothetical protein